MFALLIRPSRFTNPRTVERGHDVNARFAEGAERDELWHTQPVLRQVPGRGRTGDPDRGVDARR